MKRIIILIGVCFTIACTTQKQVITNGKKSYSIPKEGQQISPNQVATKFPDLKDKFIANSDVDFFVINGLLVGLGVRPPASDKDYVRPFDYYKNQLKSVMEGNMEQREGEGANYKVNEITLKTYNNQAFMIIDYENDKDDFVRFISFQKGSYNAYHGFVRYSKGNPKEQAYKLLDNILNNVKVSK